MKLRRIFLLTIVYFVVVTAAFVGVHYRELSVPERERTWSEILSLVQRHYVNEVNPADLLVHVFEGVRELVGKDRLAVERAADAVTLRQTDGPSLTLALAGDEGVLARDFERGMDFLADRFGDRFPPDRIQTEGIRYAIQVLDPHSAFMTAAEHEELVGETEGHFGGVGIEVTMRDEHLTVIAPIEGTPAFDAGIQAGDQIREIDGESTEGMDIQTAVNKIRGELGTKVTLGILRGVETELRQFALVRAEIQVAPIKWRMLDEGVGWVRFVTFNEKTTAGLSEALSQMEKADPPLSGLILDLRNCPGGLLSEAIGVADLFLSEGLIVYTAGRDPAQRRDYLAEDRGSRTGVPLVVLTGGATASASEIVAGALGDHGRALLVGTTTWGKGSVQSIFNLRDGSALKLTTALYYTPSGVSIQARGITPHVGIVYRTEDGAEYHPFREADLDGVLRNDTPGSPRETAMTVEVERIGEFVREQKPASEEDYFAPDVVVLFAKEILVAAGAPELSALLSAAGEIKARIDRLPLPAPAAPAPPPPAGSPAHP